MLRAQTMHEEMLRTVGIGMLGEAAARNPGHRLDTAPDGTGTDVAGGKTPADNPSGSFKAVDGATVWASSALACVEAHL